MRYAGYEAVFEYDEEAAIFHGEVANLRDVVTFQGDSIVALERAMAESLEDYFAFCRSRRQAPERPS